MAFAASGANKNARKRCQGDDSVKISCVTYATQSLTDVMVNLVKPGRDFKHYDSGADTAFLPYC